MLRVTRDMLPVLCLQSIGRSSRSDIESVHDAYVHAYALRRPLIAITDARTSCHDAAQRKLFAEWSAETFALDKGCTLATIVMLDSALLRGALTAMNWITPPPIKQIVVATPAEAVDAARRLASTHRLDVPERTWTEAERWLHGDASRKAG